VFLFGVLIYFTKSYVVLIGLMVLIWLIDFELNICNDSLQCDYFGIGCFHNNRKEWWLNSEGGEW